MEATTKVDPDGALLTGAALASGALVGATALLAGVGELLVDPQPPSTTSSTIETAPTVVRRSLGPQSMVCTSSYPMPTASGMLGYHTTVQAKGNHCIGADVSEGDRKPDDEPP